jgi:Helix-turn-helix domain
VKTVGEIIQQAKDRNIILRGADLATQKGWTGVPNFILEAKDVSVGAKLTYAMLLKYAREDDYCFPGQATLARDMGCAERSVGTYLKELQGAKLIDITRRGQGRPNLYTVHLKASFWRKSHDRGRFAKFAVLDRQPLPSLK